MPKNTENFIPTFGHLHTLILYVPNEGFELGINNDYDIQIYSGRYQCNLRKKDKYGMFNSIMNILFLDDDLDYEAIHPTKINIIQVDKGGHADYNHPHIFNIEESISSLEVLRVSGLSKNDMMVLENFIKVMKKKITH